MKLRLYRILAVPVSFGVLLSLLGASFPASAASAGAPAITARTSKLPLEKEFTRARELGRPVLAFLHTEWCEPCHRFIREILPLPEVQASLGRVHFVSYDAERGAGREVAARLGVHSFPHFILFDNEGTLCRRIPGFIPDPKIFLKQVDAMLPLARSEADIKTELAKGPLEATARLGVARWYALRGRWEQALEHLDEFQRLGAEPGTEPDDVAAALWLGAKIRRAREVCNYREGDPACHARDEDLPGWRRHLVDDGAALVRRYPGTPAAARALRMVVLSGLVGDAERDELIGVMGESMKRPSDVVLVALAAHAYDPALLLGQRGVKLAPRDVSALTNLAEVYHYRGEREQALLMIDKARQIDTAEAGGKLSHQLDDNRRRYKKTSKNGEPSPIVEFIRRQTNELMRYPGLDPESDF